MLNDCFKVLHGFQARTLVMLCPCLHVVEFVCLWTFFNAQVKTHNSFNFSNMSLYILFILWVYLNFFMSNIIFFSVWIGSTWKSHVFGWRQTQLPSAYCLHTLRLDLASFWLFPFSREILRDIYLFQLLHIFISFHCYVFAYFWSLSNS